ncbi:hypothetical protein EV360DRAFT_73940 [Lentinula raphanica]|nr:hypothetical protein EV360DRAFT_73940 [Lentinula raphanica]
MVQWVQPTSTTNRIVTTILLSVAQILTVFRLYIRNRAKRLWWDDAWALLSMLLSLVLLITMWIRTDIPGRIHFDSNTKRDLLRSWTIKRAPFCPHSSILACIYHFYMYALVGKFFDDEWVEQVCPDKFDLFRDSTHSSAIRLKKGSLAQKTYVCASDRSWYQLAAPQCHLGTAVAIVELVNIALAVIPIRLLAGVGLSSDKRRMLYIMFCASLLTSMVSIIHAVFLLGPSGLLEAITAQAEAGTALIVANAGVLSPYVYRLMKDGEDFDNEPYTYYPSFQSNGEVRMRRMPRSPGRTAASTVRFNVGTQADSLMVSEMELQTPEKPKTEPSLSMTFESDFEQKSVTNPRPLVWNLASSSKG